MVELNYTTSAKVLQVEIVTMKTEKSYFIVRWKDSKESWWIWQLEKIPNNTNYLYESLPLDAYL